MVKKLVIAFLVLLGSTSCGNRVKQVAPVYHSFPIPTVPAVVQDNEERVRYMSRNFWNSFLSVPEITDSSAISSVRTEDVEQAFSSYLAILDMLPIEESRARMADLFDKVEACQAQDSSSLFYLRFTEIVAKYLYDPNSPVRNEDYYLPFVKGMAASRFTSEDMRTAYQYESQMCAINQIGEQVPDFTFKDIKERIHSLYGVKADYTLMLFSNPGCHSCLEIKEQIERIAEIDGWIASGRLAIVNIYIDQELDKWREYEPTYPRSWVSGYDNNFIIREDILYNVRAIPSLYLLDSDKRVILKDPTTEKALNTLIALMNNQ